MIYANSYLESGEFLAGINRQQEGIMMLRRADLISPEMRVSTDQVRMRFGLGR
jgi:hypothetical protein